MIKLSRWQNGYVRKYKEPKWHFFDYDLVKKKGKWRLRRYDRATLTRRVAALRDFTEGKFIVKYERNWETDDYDDILMSTHWGPLGFQ